VWQHYKVSGFGQSHILRVQLSFFTSDIGQVIYKSSRFIVEICGRVARMFGQDQRIPGSWLGSSPSPTRLFNLHMFISVAQLVYRRPSDMPETLMHPKDPLGLKESWNLTGPGLTGITGTQPK
jgi:hypothetical protein